MTRSTLICLCLVAAAAAPGAASGSAGVRTAPPAAGPVLAGDAVLWAVPRADGGFAVRRAEGDAGASTVGSFSSPPPTNYLKPALAASADRWAVAFATGESDSPWLRRTVLAAPPGGEFEALDRDCNLFGTPDRPRSFDVSGPLVAYGRCTADGRHEVAVRDFSMPVPVDDVVPGARPLGLRIAGRYVAWLEDGAGQVFVDSGISVYDRVTRELVYRIPKQAMPGAVHDIDLQDDGTVAFSYASGGMRIGWASPAEPSPHTVPIPARENYEVRIAQDRIAFESGVQPGLGEVDLATVGVTDLAGNSQRLGNLGQGSEFTDDFDFDGERLAWWVYGCASAIVRVVDASGPAAISPPRTGCALRFQRRPTIDRRRVRLYVNCFGFANGICSARDVVIAAHPDGERLVLGKGRRARRVHLTRRGQALLRRKGRLRASVSATLTDLAGRHEHRRGSLTLTLPSRP